MDDISRNPKPFQGQGTCLDVKSIGLNEEDRDYITKIKELQDHLDTGEPLADPGKYRRLVGKLNYLTITRPDISFAVSVSQFLQSPCDSHWDAIIRILRYIKSAPGKGLLYEIRGHTQIVGYSDADWAGTPSDRRSTSGFCVLVEETLYLGKVRSKLWLPDQVQRQSIMQWPQQLVSSFG